MASPCLCCAAQATPNKTFFRLSCRSVISTFREFSKHGMSTRNEDEQVYTITLDALSRLEPRIQTTKPLR